MHAAIYRAGLKKSMIDHALSKVRDRIAAVSGVIISLDVDTRCVRDIELRNTF